MSQSTSHDTFVIERTYDAPVDQVFRAWSEPKLKARWFAGSVDALDAGYELDFRIGGRERNVGGPPGGPVYTYESDYRDIVPEERIVYTYEMSAGSDRISVSVATIEFKGVGAQTQLILTEQGVYLDGLDNAPQREEGTRQMLETLAAALKD
jgi:uncharacterized protein YndB with AHSA1/START domain